MTWTFRLSVRVARFADVKAAVREWSSSCPSASGKIETYIAMGSALGNRSDFEGPAAVAVLGSSKYNRTCPDETMALAGKVASDGGRKRILIAGLAICPSQSTTIMPC